MPKSSAERTNARKEEIISAAESLYQKKGFKDITIQAWSPFQHGFIDGTFIDNPDYREVNDAMQKIADKYDVNKTTIAVAWILRHPAGMQVVCGTTKKERFRDCCRACDIELTYEDWYNIYLAAGYPIM